VIRLYLAPSTVKGHTRLIFDKRYVRRRTEAVARARVACSSPQTERSDAGRQASVGIKVSCGPRRHALPTIHLQP
jgi:hypothetical protein